MYSCHLTTELGHGRAQSAGSVFQSLQRPPHWHEAPCNIYSWTSAAHTRGPECEETKSIRYQRSMRCASWNVLPVSDSWSPLNVHTWSFLFDVCFHWKPNLSMLQRKKSEFWHLVDLRRFITNHFFVFHSGEHSRVKHQYVRSRCPTLWMEGKTSDGSMYSLLCIFCLPFLMQSLFRAKDRGLKAKMKGEKKQLLPSAMEYNKHAETFARGKGALSHWDWTPATF